MQRLKKIGLIGGTGPESTLSYYKELNQRIDKQTCGKEMPDIAIESVNFRKAWRYMESSDMVGLADYLAEKVTYLRYQAGILGNSITEMKAFSLDIRTNV